MYSRNEVVYKVHAGWFINRTPEKFINCGLFIQLKGLLCGNPTERGESLKQRFCLQPHNISSIYIGKVLVYFGRRKHGYRNCWSRYGGRPAVLQDAYLNSTLGFAYIKIASALLKKTGWITPLSSEELVLKFC